MITIELIEDLEKEFKSNDYNGNGDDYKIIPANCDFKLMVSASHSVKHVRWGNELVSDAYTGSLVKILNKDLGIACIYKNRNNNDDVNYDIDTKYEQELAKYIKENNIKCIIDFHISHWSRPYDIEIEDNEEQNIKSFEYLYPIIKGNILGSDLKISHNKTFMANGQGNMSRETNHNTNIACFQFEINAKILNVNDLEVYKNTYNVIKQIIIDINNVL